MANNSSSLRPTSLSNPNVYYMVTPAQASTGGAAAASPTAVESAALQALAALRLSSPAATNTSNSRASLSPLALEDARIADAEQARFGSRIERPRSAQPGPAQARHLHTGRMSVTLGGGQSPSAQISRRGEHPTHSLVNFGQPTDSRSTSTSPHNAVSPTPFRPHIVGSHTVERHSAQSPPPIAAFVRGVPQGARISVSSMPTDLASATDGTYFVIENTSSLPTHLVSDGEDERNHVLYEDEGDDMLYHDRTVSTSHAPTPQKPEDRSQI